MSPNILLSGKPDFASAADLDDPDGSIDRALKAADVRKAEKEKKRFAREIAIPPEVLPGSSKMVFYRLRKTQLMLERDVREQARNSGTVDRLKNQSYAKMRVAEKIFKLLDFRLVLPLPELQRKLEEEYIIPWKKMLFEDQVYQTKLPYDPLNFHVKELLDAAYQIERTIEDEMRQAA